MKRGEENETSAVHTDGGGEMRRGKKSAAVSPWAKEGQTPIPKAGIGVSPRFAPFCRVVKG
jgi:hypothetical protein